MMKPLKRVMLLRYGILGVPLAFAGLPIYVHVPKFYVDILHMDLAVLGSLLLILRLCDAVIDPLIGCLSDRFRNQSRTIMAACVPIFILGYAALFSPPEWAMSHSGYWLAGCLCVVYLSFSALMINYYAMGVGMAQEYHDHTRIAAFREGLMLVGVLLASILPTLLLQHFDARNAYGIFSLLLAPLLIVCAGFCLSAHVKPVNVHEQGQLSFFRLLTDTNIRWVLAIAFFNAIPTAITSTLFLFFTQDVLHAESYSGPLLGLYFLSAACGMPLWSGISYRLSKKSSLLIAMVTATVCFVWAYMLGAGDIVSFAIICVLSGMTLGADSMLLPSMLADTLADKSAATATGFGLWNLTNKLTMACAAGIALPLLAAAGYHSAAGNGKAALLALSFCYALLPCAFKAVAILLLYISPLDKRKAT